MEVRRFKENNFKANNFLVIDGKTAVLIDASVSVDEIEEVLEEVGAELKAVFLTHSHFDHVLNLDNILSHFKVLAYIHKDGMESLCDAVKNESGLENPLIIKNMDNILPIEKDGQEILIDELKIVVHHTPGHSSCSVLYEIGDYMFTGDTVFKGLIGRNDLWNSDPIKQQNSLRKILRLPAKELYFAGHGVHFDNNFLIKTVNRYLI